MIYFGVTVCWCWMRAAKSMGGTVSRFHFATLCDSFQSLLCNASEFEEGAAIVNPGDIEVVFFGVAEQDAYVRVRFLAKKPF